RDKRVEPDDPGGKRNGYELTCRGSIEVERAVQVAKADVDTVALAQYLADCGIRLAAAECLRDVHQCERRHGQAQPLGQHPTDELGDKCLRALPRATELDDEHAVVGIHYRRKRAALTQWLDVSLRSESG